MKPDADVDQRFVAMFAEHRDALYAVALRLSGPAEAEDLAAESFLRAYRAMVGYDADRLDAIDARPWLLTVLLNAWRNRVRTAARHPTTAWAADRDPGVAASQDGIADRHDLVAALAQLPEAQRVAVVLRHVADVPTAEVAAVLGCPEATARSHLARGLARLRVALTEEVS